MIEIKVIMFRNVFFNNISKNNNTDICIDSKKYYKSTYVLHQR